MGTDGKRDEDMRPELLGAVGTLSPGHLKFAMDHGSASEEIDDLARQLFAASDPGGVWAIADHGTQLYWRREAQRRLQAERYKEISPSL
jgi:predicted methyltransferase